MSVKSKMTPILMEAAGRWAYREKHEEKPKYKTFGAFCIHDAEKLFPEVSEDSVRMLLLRIEKTGGIVRLGDKARCPYSSIAHTWYRINRKPDRPTPAQIKEEKKPISGIGIAKQVFEQKVETDITIIENALLLLEDKKQQIVDELGMVERTIAGLNKLRR